MSKMSQRDAEKIKGILKEVDGQVITTKGCTITIPVRYETVGLATVGSDTNFYGLFKITTLDGSYHAIHNMMGFVHSEPDNIETFTHEESGEPYYLLTYEAGSVVVKDTNILVDSSIIVKVFREFITRGKVPYYVTYDDMNRVFETVKEYAGESIADSFEIIAVPISIVARNPDDINQYYREILDKVDKNAKPPIYVPASSVNFSANSALTKITGSYFYTGVVSAINNPTDTTEVLDYTLRY